jgi:hypothetical protein
MWDIVKTSIVSLCAAIWTYLEPLYNPMFVLGYLFVLDIFFGILVDLFKNKDRIRLKKFLIAVAFLAMYLLIIASVFVIGEHQNDKDEALYFIKVLTYVFIYFYMANIIKNMRQLFPNSKPIAFLDYFLGLQVVKRLPELAQFLGLTKNKANETN